MISDDANFWGVSPWTHDDLKGQPIECDWHDGVNSVTGQGKLEVVTLADGLQKIEISQDRWTSEPGKLEVLTIGLPSAVFQHIKKHPEKEGFILNGP